MATYTVGFYDLNPSGVIPTTASSTFTWTASDEQVGSATITDNESGIQELTLDDDSNGGETATADVTINGNSSTGSNVDAELVWTVRDTVTGDEFQIIQFDVENGAAAGDYTLSELPLVTGRQYEVLDYDSNPNAAAGDIAFTYTDYVAPDRVIDGTSGDDTIDATYTDDPQGDAPDDGGGDGTGGLNDTINAGAGNDTINGGAGDDTIDGGADADTIQFSDGFGDDNVDGGSSGTDDDTLDFSQVTSPVSGTYSGSETGSITSGADSVTFSDIENLILTDGADQINASADSAGVDIAAGDGADVITGGSGDDTVYGEGGNDTITGGAGDDTIYGDGTPDTSGDTETLNWSTQGADGADLSAGFTQSTGDMDVSVSFANDGNNSPEFAVESGDTIYTASGEDFDTTSSLYLFGEGDGATSTTTIDFAASGAGVSDEVQNVEFRISDIDAFATNHLDEVTITAYDADGNPVPVTITTTGNDTISGDTVTAGNTLDSPGDAAGSVLVSIAGPVASIEIAYSNNETPSSGYTGTQAINVSDVHFNTIPAEPSGDDILAGGLGDDTIIGGAGDDQITVAEGDVATGGAGDDTFILTDLGEAGGSDTITIVGGEDDETLGDTLNLGGLVNPADITYTNTDDASGGLSGNFTLADGTVVNFSEIENVVICFAAGTRILTPRGERPIEDLEIGDMVITADNGLQPIRWIGKRTVSALGDLAPVKIRKGTFSNTRDLLVSPQHRMLLSGYRAELLFGESEVLAPAIHLLDDHAVTRQVAEEVTYIHLLFDQHELVFAEGTPSESFHPGHVGMNAILDPAREELFRIFPELRCNLGAYGPTSRLCLKKHETKALMSY